MEYTLSFVYSRKRARERLACAHLCALRPRVECVCVSVRSHTCHVVRCAGCQHCYARARGRAHVRTYALLKCVHACTYSHRGTGKHDAHARALTLCWTRESTFDRADVWSGLPRNGKRVGKRHICSCRAMWCWMVVECFKEKRRWMMSRSHVRGYAVEIYAQYGNHNLDTRVTLSQDAGVEMLDFLCHWCNEL